MNIWGVRLCLRCTIIGFVDSEIFQAIFFSKYQFTYLQLTLCFVWFGLMVHESIFQTVSSEDCIE